MPILKRAQQFSLACLVGLLIAGCGEREVLPSLVEIAEAPAPEGSAEPNLSVSPSGEVFLSWLEREEGGAHSLRYSKLPDLDGTWSPPVTVLTRDDLFVNWADFPSLLPTRSGRLIAHWLQNSGDGPYTYDVRIAQSADDGKTWSQSRILHDDGLQAEHGFVSLFESPDGELQAVWLDGRNTVSSLTNPEMQLGFTTISADGVPGATQLLDTRICDCCQTSAAWAAAGPVVVYRDRSADEIRDTSIVRYVDGAWTQPASVHPDNWRIEGCPVNGPAVAALGETIAVAWFTGANDEERVNLAFSADGGASFGEPIRVDDGNPVGRVSVSLSAGGKARVAWIERTGEQEEAEIRLRMISDDGVRSAPLLVTKTSAARDAGFPRMASVGEDLILAWTDISEGTRVRVARLRPGS